MRKQHFTLDKSSIRTWGAVCCMICMVFMLFTGTENTYAQNQTEIVAVSSTAEKGGTAKVALNLSNNPGIWGLKFKVGYNHNVMTLQSVEVGDVFTTDEVILPESLDNDYFLFYATEDKLENISTNGTLVVLEFQVSENATVADYAISVELTQCINVDGNDVNITMTGGKVTVVNCLHSQRELKITEGPKCEKTGTETEICKKCGHVFGTRDIKETGHLNTEVRDAVSATETKEGYTGDTYCKDCNKLLKKGTDIPKEIPKAPATGQPDSPIGGMVIVLIVAIIGDLILMKTKFNKMER